MPIELGAFLGKRRVDLYPSEDDKKKEESHHDPGYNAREKHPAYRLVSEHGIDDEIPAGRNQPSQRSYAGHNARRQLSVVPIFVHLRYGHRCEGCRSREGRSGNRLEDRGANHGRQCKPAGHVTDILSNRVIELPRHTRIIDNLSHKDEKRNYRVGIRSEGAVVILSKNTDRSVERPEICQPCKTTIVMAKASSMPERKRTSKPIRQYSRQRIHSCFSPFPEKYRISESSMWQRRPHSWPRLRGRRAG